ncbi:MAG: hypothetical protein WCG45_00405 [bacterium]
MLADMVGENNLFSSLMPLIYLGVTVTNILVGGCMAAFPEIKVLIFWKKEE